ncbi:MAG: N-formylglutamate amidohydrolase [Prevotella sp.]|nr:N-formylglutamate amidohydrolase [Prevotella sp.]
MEKKKELTWEEKHPFGNLRYYTFQEGFEGVPSLGEAATKSALRVLKRHLEDEMGFELSDEQFLSIFSTVINLKPARPIGAWSFHYGFVVPMKKLLQEQNLYCGVKEIFDFFNIRNCDNRRYNFLLLHVPHSSRTFPDSSMVSFNDLDEEERLLIDYYTDELFIPTQTYENIENIVFPYCRLYCDVECLFNDPLEKEGLGISYSRWVKKDKYSEIHRSFSSLTSVFKMYSDFHTEASLKLLKANGTELVIDCHSFSNHPNLLCPTPPNIDICIGYNNDGTHPYSVTLGNIIQYFKSCGYKVGINEPFSNSKTFSVPVKYHSVKIEVNKRLYMNEDTLEKTEGFEKLKQDIQSLYNIILKTK